MRRNGKMFLALLVAVLAFGALAPLKLSQAQGSAVALTLAVTSFDRDVYTDKLISDFEAANPGVKLSIVASTAGIPSPVTGVEKHLEEVQKYASSADVLYVDGNRLTQEATKAGLYLDLAPLVKEDKTLKPEDFYPALWQAFQWNKGFWALPTSASVLVLTYKPAAFDKAGLAYPDEKWTLGDLENAVRKLAVRDPNGKVVEPGIEVAGTNQIVLFRSLLGEGLYEPNSVPNPPQLSKPGAVAMLDTWFKVDQEGLVGSTFNVAPIGVGPALGLILPTDPEQKRIGTLLPGGKAGLDAQAFAVSAGTQYPEKAYALVKFLTTRPEIASRFSGIPARKSLVGADSGQGFMLNLPADVKKLSERAVENGFSISDIRYAPYLALALNKMKFEKLDAKAALEAAELQAVKDQQVATDKKGKITVVVATPAPELALKGGKTSLKFGLVIFSNTVPQRDKWDKLITDFVASDPQVGRIELNAGAGLGQMEALVEQQDCFYLPFNAVPNVNPALLLNLDPFMAADKTFDKADVLGNVMAQLQRDNKIWALPITIEPSVLKYDPAKFRASNVPAPTAGWTLDTFKDALKALKIDPKDPAPFEAPNTGGAHLLMLIASYGALPLDYRTDPPTINYIAPATVDAIRQVLDLAKQGYIKYEAIGSLIPSFRFGGQDESAPIITDALSLLSFRRILNPTGNDSYKPTTYPKGSKFSAASYNIGTAYISAKARNPEACYRWLSAVAKHADLFSAMPARRSMLNDPATAQAEGQDAIALYKQIDTLISDPNTVSIPSQFSGGASPIGFLQQLWLYEAFDTYVLKDGDLEAALKEAETKGKAFQTCAAKLPPLDASNQAKAREYIKAYGDCATKLDPKLKAIFSLIQ